MVRLLWLVILGGLFVIVSQAQPVPRHAVGTPAVVSPIVASEPVHTDEAFVYLLPTGPFAPTLEELLPSFARVAPPQEQVVSAAAAGGAVAPAPLSVAAVSLDPLFITLEQLDAYAAEAGWSGESWQLMRRIIVECECRSLNVRAHNSSDPSGGSHGLAQLNGRYWFDRYGEDFEQRYDPVVNLRTARKLYEERGRFGGAGGWSCAGLLGIY